MQNESSGDTPDVCRSEVGRRRLVTALTVSAGTAAVAALVPRAWIKPVVDTIVVPAHAQGTSTLTISNLTITPVGTTKTEGQADTPPTLMRVQFGFSDLIALVGPDNTQLLAVVSNVPDLTDCTSDIHRWAYLLAAATVTGTPAAGTIAFNFDLTSALAAGCGADPFLYVRLRYLAPGAERQSNALSKRILGG